MLTGVVSTHICPIVKLHSTVLQLVLWLVTSADVAQLRDSNRILSADERATPADLVARTVHYVVREILTNSNCVGHKKGTAR